MKNPSYKLIILVIFLFSAILSYSQPPARAVNAFPYVESFEYVYGHWQQDESDDFDWTVNVSITPFDGTGPVSAYDGDCYVYTRASEHYPRKQACLVSPLIDISRLREPLLSFAYHMYGEHMGQLKVLISFDNGLTWTEKLCAYDGNKGNRWYVAQLELRRYSGKQIRFRFEAVTGDGMLGDLALDYVFVGESADFSFRDGEDMACRP